jgi:hypothetical protein
MSPVFSVLAFSHHIGDTILDMQNASKNKRLFWAGIGVGWSAFFLGFTLYQSVKPQLVETKSYTLV